MGPILPGTRGTEGYRVLLIDDDPNVLPCLTEILQQLTNYTVFTADNGLDGLEQIYQRRPHCVVVDISMPGIDGFQVIRTIRAEPELANTAFVILTAMTQDHYRNTGIAVGADQFLLKPMRTLPFLDAVHHAIARRQQFAR